MRVAAIIPAAGRGERMRSERPKALALLLARPLLAWTLQPFLNDARFSDILIAYPADHRESFAELLENEAGSTTRTRLVAGGETRQESVRNCLREAPTDCKLVAVHDAARPLLSSTLLSDVLRQADSTGAAIAAVPCNDTVKLCTQDGVVMETLERSRLRLVQTPQCFRRDLLVSAYEKAARERFQATDDSALVERLGESVRVVMGSYQNIKVTTPEDILVCEQILSSRQAKRDETTL